MLDVLEVIRLAAAAGYSGGSVKGKPFQLVGVRGKYRRTAASKKTKQTRLPCHRKSETADNSNKRNLETLLCSLQAKQYAARGPANLIVLNALLSMLL